MLFKQSPGRKRILATPYLLLFCLYFCFFPRANIFGQEEKTGDTPAASGIPLATNINPLPQGEAIVTLVVNGRRYGDVEAKIDMDDPFLQVSLLKQVLAPSLSQKEMDRVFGVILSKLEYAGIADLAAAGITGVWDMETLTYSISTPGEYARVKEIHFVEETPLNENVWLKPANFAAVVNTSIAGSVSFSSMGVNVPVTVNFDGLFKVFSVAIESNASVAFSAPTFSWYFNSARAVYDFPGIEGRLYAGIVSLEGTGYQSRSEVYGVTLHNVDVFGRYSRNYSPSIAFTLQKPSTVRIVINGTVVKTFKLDMGNYKLYDLPFAYGMNSMVVEVEDGTNPDGSILYRPVTTYITTETGLLVRGKMDYGISAGVGRQEPDEPIGSAYIRYGLFPALTTGLNVAVDKRSVMGGVNLVAGTGIGGFIVNAAVVSAWDGRARPFAYSGDLEYHFAMPANKNMPSFTLAAGYTSRGFAVPAPSDAVPQDTDALVKASASIGGSISTLASFGVGGSWSHTFGSDPQDTGSVSASMGFAATKQASFTLGANASFLADETSPQFSATLGLHISDPRRPSRQVGISQASQGTNTINYNDQFPNSKSIGYGITGTNIFGGVKEPSSVNFNSGFSTQYFSLSGNAGVTYGSSLASPTGALSLNLASGLAFIDGYFALSRPLYDSFVLFVPEKSTGKMSVSFIVNQSNKLITHGLPVAASVSSYKNSRLAMDFPEADADVVPTNPQAAVAATYRSGFLFKGGLEKLLYVSGRLLDAGGNPIGLVAGDVFKEDGTLISQTFTDDTGTFQIYGLTSGTYKIAWPDTIGTTIIRIEGNESGLVEIGDVHATR